MWVLFFIALAAICNAVMDTVMHHYSESIFSKYDPTWWDETISRLNKYVNRDINGGVRKDRPVQFSDAWHFFKFLTVVFFCLAAMASAWDPYMKYFYMIPSWASFCLVLLTLGGIYTHVFNIFYNYVFKK